MSDATMAQPGRNQAFHSVPGKQHPYNTFDLSHTKHLTADIGKVIPVLAMECVPGDRVDLGCDMLIRTQALLAPVMDGLKASVYYFFVPNRLTWPKIDTSGNDWETFITGGNTGLLTPTLPTWNVGSGNHGEGSLWDYMGLPTWTAANDFTTQYPDAVVPMSLPKRAYNLIWNEYVRDENLQTEVSIDQEALLNWCWTKDYFTSALTSQQRGTAPTLPVTGTTTWTSATFPQTGITGAVGIGGNASLAGQNQLGAAVGVTAIAQANTVGAFNANTITAQSVNISSLRLAIATQQLLEKTMVGGARYTEYLQNIYGTSPKDSTLQRPQYIGGTMQPVIFSEVLQQSASNTQPTPQGNMAGHGISVGQGHVGSYQCVEFGYIIGLLRVMPEPSYSQGIPKMWTRPTKLEWYNPYFTGLSEQAVLNQELYVAADGVNQTIFGYQARYNELRYERSTVHGVLRSTLNYWTLTRQFAARPALNASFVSLTDAEITTLKRVTPVTTQPWLIIQLGNRITAKRPLPVYATPGLTEV